MDDTKGIQKGNWLFDNGGVARKVTAIRDDSVDLDGEPNVMSAVKPIPLKEEMLPINGFRSLLQGFYNDYRLRSPDCKHVFGVAFYPSGLIKVYHDKDAIHFRSLAVHELQNAMMLMGVKHEIHFLGKESEK